MAALFLKLIESRLITSIIKPFLQFISVLFHISTHTHTHTRTHARTCLVCMSMIYECSAQVRNQPAVLQRRSCNRLHPPLHCFSWRTAMRILLTTGHATAAYRDITIRTFCTLILAHTK